MLGNDTFEIVFLSVLSLTMVMLFVAVFYLVKKPKENRDLKKARLERIEKSNLSVDEKDLMIHLAERIFVIYYSYALHTTIYMFCNICGLLYTISTFVMSFSPNNDYKIYLLAFLSIFFVIIIIYTKPQRRSTQYLLAWRRLTNAFNVLIYYNVPSTSPNSYPPHAVTQNEKRVDYIINLMKDIEDSFTADEDNT